jgi:hypothetical protein
VPGAPQVRILNAPVMRRGRDGAVYARFTEIYFLRTYDPVGGPWSTDAATSASFAQISGGLWADGWTISSGDFNGDGLRDLLLYNPASGQFFKALNQGNGQFTFFGYFWASGWTPTIGDFDGDGKSDVLLYNRSSGA